MIMLMIHSICIMLSAGTGATFSFDNRPEVGGGGGGGAWFINNGCHCNFNVCSHQVAPAAPPLHVAL